VWGSATVNSGGTLSASTNGAAGTLTVGNGLTLNSGSLLRFDIGAPGTSDLINVTGGTFTVNGGGAITLDTSLGGLAAGEYNLIDYVGAAGGAGLAASRRRRQH
jgi:hypothetical protein